MNRFQKFLDETGIAAGHRHTAAERASYFIWYHMRATGEPEADLEVIAAYLNESGTTVPELHGLYEELVRPGQLVTRAPIPGRLRTSSAKSMDEKYQVSVFESKGLAPLYFYRAANGGLIRVGSIKDVIKYWPHRSWIAAWVVFILGVLGLVVSIALSAPPASQAINSPPRLDGP